MTGPVSLQRRGLLTAALGAGASTVVPTRIRASTPEPHLDSKLFALDPVTGDLRWERSVGSAATALFANGGLYVAADRGLEAFTPTDGERLWTTEPAVLVSHVVRSQLPHPATDGQRLFAVFEDGNLYAVDTDSGEQHWSFPLDTDLHSASVVDDGTVYVGYSDVSGEDGPGTIYAIDAATGEQRWRLSVDQPVVNSLTVDDDTLFVGTASRPDPVGGTGQLRAVDVQTGDTEWVVSTDTGVSDTIGIATGSNGRVGITVLGAHTVWAFDPVNGEQLWAFDTEPVSGPLGIPISRTPVIVDGAVYVPEMGVTKRDLSTGEVMTTLDDAVEPKTHGLAQDDERWYVGINEGVTGIPHGNGDRWTTHLRERFPNHAASSGISLLDESWIAQPVVGDDSLFVVGSQFQETSLDRDRPNTDDDDDPSASAQPLGLLLGGTAALCGLLYKLLGPTNDH